MSLKTTVKVGNITNLSDARYAAGMGADMLGFCVVNGQPDYIETTTFQQIRGWVTGPKIVIQLYGIKNASDIGTLIENHVPDYIELTLAEYSKFGNTISLPMLVSVAADELANLPNEARNIAFWLVDEPLVESLPKHPVTYMVNVSSKETLESLLDNNLIGGIALSGSKEIRPGFKDYDDLAEIFEALEE